MCALRRACVRRVFSSKKKLERHYTRHAAVPTTRGGCRPPCGSSSTFNMAAIQISHPRASGRPSRTSSTALMIILGSTVDCLAIDTDMAITDTGRLGQVLAASTAGSARLQKRLAAASPLPESRVSPTAPSPMPTARGLPHAETSPVPLRAAADPRRGLVVVTLL